MGTPSSEKRPFQIFSEKQHGLISAEQLTALGWTRSARHRAVTSGKLAVVRRGVLRVVGTPWQWEADILAAVLSGGPGAVASHRSALRLWRIVQPDDEGWTSWLDITCPGEVRLAGVTVHQRPAHTRETAVRFGVPVTSAARTLLDLAETSTPQALGRIVDDTLRRKIVNLGTLRALLPPGAPRGRPRPGSSVLRAVLADRAGGWDPGASDWERHMDRCWEQWGLPPSVRQHTISTPGGRYRPDRVILPLRIAVDWNGYEWHGTRSGFDRDSDRRAHLVAAGWLPLDFTTNSAPELICATVRAACQDRRRLLGPH